MFVRNAAFIKSINVLFKTKNRAIINIGRENPTTIDGSLICFFKELKLTIKQKMKKVAKSKIATILKRKANPKRKPEMINDKGLMINFDLGF